MIEDLERRYAEDDYNRDLITYRHVLFPDDGRVMKGLTCANVLFFNKVEGGARRKQLHLTNRKLYGGQKGFFSPRATILDIGSDRLGMSVIDINEDPDFIANGIRAWGIDKKYYVGIPNHPSAPMWFKAGVWQSMPFENNSFNRLFSFETFPAYLWLGHPTLDDVANTFSEITRIAKPRAMWRGTLHTHANEEIDTNHVVPSLMVDHGWEVYIFPDAMGMNYLFAARLVEK